MLYLHRHQCADDDTVLNKLKTIFLTTNTKHTNMAKQKLIQLRARKQGIGFLKDEEGIVPKMFVTHAVKYSTLSLDDIVKNIADSIGVSQAITRASVNAILKQMQQLLLNGHSIQLGDLFTIRLVSVSKGVKDPVQVSTDNIVRISPKLTPGRRIRDGISEISFSTTVIE